MTCYCCTGEAYKFGIYRGHQRYRCKTCGKTFSDIPEGPLSPLRVPIEKVCQVVEMLVEGVGVRAIERLTRLNRRTVLSVLEVAGRRCALVLEKKVRNVPAENVQVDELWAFVFCKQQNAEIFCDHQGDQYTYLAIERDTKLIISHLSGKRNVENTVCFIDDLRERTTGRFQLTTDGFIGYKGGHKNKGAVWKVFGPDIDYATEVKRFRGEIDGPRRYSAPECIGVERKARIGQPNLDDACTSHVERTNLSVRMFNRRFTRLTLGYSKKLANHRHSVSILIAHFNFCRIHSAHKETPAQASGLTDRKWTVQELLTGDLTARTSD